MPLVNRSDVKTWLGIAGTSEDLFLDLAIESCEAGLERALGRNLESQAYTEYLSGTGRTALNLPHRPVTAVASLQILDGPRGPVVETLTEGQHYRLIDSRPHERNVGHVEMTAGTVWTYDLCAAYWPPGTANIAVTFTAGYTADTLPADLKLALYQMIALARAARSNGQLLSDETLGDYSYSLATGGGFNTLPTSVLATLARYREVPV